MKDHKQVWLVIVLSAMAVSLFLFYVLVFAPEGNQDFYDALQDYYDAQGNADLIQQSPGADVIAPEICETAGGTWNSCGSACRTDPDAICIELCIEYCECKDINQCPSGYTCGDFVDGVGVCL